MGLLTKHEWDIKKFKKYVLNQFILLPIVGGLFIGIYYFIPNPEDVIRPNKLSAVETLGCLDQLNQDELKVGKGNMKNHKVVICGITRDNAKELPKVIPYIEKTGNLFKDYRVIVFENDSKDGTKKILHHWQLANQRVYIESKDYGNTKRPSIDFLAKIRNLYLKQLEQNPEYKDFDMVMIVDLDMSYGWDLRGIFHSFKQFDDWEGVCSNGVGDHIGTMWDTFAFRREEPPSRLQRQPQYWKLIMAQEFMVHSPNASLIPVHSCFGGLAFYKKSYMKNCRYDSIDEDCEHIPFHACVIRNQGRMVMNPAQIVRYSHYE